MDNDCKRWAQLIWKYLKLGQPLVKSDVIIGLGCHDIRVAERAAELYLEGWAPQILFTGYLGNHTKGVWNLPEADVFAETAIKLGVPAHRILLEKKATNTGENIRFAYQTLTEQHIPGPGTFLYVGGIRAYMKNWIKRDNVCQTRGWPHNGLQDVKRIILVQQPFMERRIYATYLRQWPGGKENVQVIVTSPPMELDTYPNPSVGTLVDLIGYMLAALERIRDYPKKGFQVEQDTSPEVWEAYRKLLQTGFQPK